MKNNLAILTVIFTFLFLFSGCATPRNNGEETTARRRGDDKTVIEVTQPLTLADYLVRVPGVIVEGNQVSIRGGGPPLFIIDGTRVGHSYLSAAGAVNVNDIESVEVLKSPSELAMYGIEGQNGVIIIRTRTQ